MPSIAYSCMSGATLRDMPTDVDFLCCNCHACYGDRRLTLNFGIYVASCA